MLLVFPALFFFGLTGPVLLFRPFLCGLGILLAAPFGLGSLFDLLKLGAVDSARMRRRLVVAAIVPLWLLECVVPLPQPAGLGPSAAIAVVAVSTAGVVVVVVLGHSSRQHPWSVAHFPSLSLFFAFDLSKSVEAQHGCLFFACWLFELPFAVTELLWHGGSAAADAILAGGIIAALWLVETDRFVRPRLWRLLLFFIQNDASADILRDSRAFEALKDGDVPTLRVLLQLPDQVSQLGLRLGVELVGEGPRELCTSENERTTERQRERESE